MSNQERIALLEQALRECFTEEGACAFYRGRHDYKTKRILAINNIVKDTLKKVEIV